MRGGVVTSDAYGQIVLEPHGFVRLDNCSGTDLDVVNSARVSLLGNKSQWAEDTPGLLTAADSGLIRYLMKAKHGTPFEHNFFRFHVRCPIFVMREWHRHRIGASVNELSGRYAELKPLFYNPSSAGHLRSQVGKPGHYRFEEIDDPIVTAMYDEAYGHAYTVYLGLLARNVAKELARCVLPVGLYSEMYWSCNARALMHFLELRNAPTALKEIRLYAQALETIFVEHMPVTARAFIDNGRICP